jgi:hypothetical protein
VGRHKKEDCGPSQSRHKVRNDIKITNTKRAGDVAQVPSKHKALSSKPQPSPKTKIKKKVDMNMPRGMSGFLVSFVYSFFFLMYSSDISLSFKLWNPELA